MRCVIQTRLKKLFFSMLGNTCAVLQTQRTKSWTRLKQFRMHTSLLIRHPIPPRPAGLRQRQKDKAGQPAGVHSIDTVNVRCVHRTLSPPTGDILSLYCFFQLISYLLITLPSLVFLLAGIQMVKGASYF